tara:strand:- start:209796 stop:209996 length:201 start_codon:yes stop_codon:yes gene_type:complete
VFNCAGDRTTPSGLPAVRTLHGAVAELAGVARSNSRSLFSPCNVADGGVLKAHGIKHRNIDLGADA